MRKILTLISLFLFFSCSDDTEVSKIKKDLTINENLKSVNFKFLSNNVLLAIIDSKQDKIEHYFYIQHENNIDRNLLKDSKYDIEFKETFLSLKNSKLEIIFSLEDKNASEFLKSDNIYFSVYGLSERHTGKKNKLSLSNLASKLKSSLTCHSGGEGAEECSTESGNPIAGGSCSVKCKDGYYACCDDTKNECKCIKETDSGGDGSNIDNQN